MGTFNGVAPTILVVEDSADTRAIIRLELERWGYTVVEAADGREAIEMTESACPDLILMDISMPVVDGLEAAPLTCLPGDPGHPHSGALRVHGAGVPRASRLGRLP
jgi:AmiR/NasT family two-component response regulator